jgi:N-acetylated-alpha-linked acidic dipeptidase
MPMSSADAIQLLKRLNGHGPSAEDLGRRWQEGGLGYYGVDYNVGPSPTGLFLNLVNQADILNVQIHNVIGTIPGKTDKEVVIVGNHRDAWGPGAGDPGSGSAALNEVIRSFGIAHRQGWRPERTIVFASFEGEEFLQIGSLLWVTKHLDWLRSSAVAYLNIVVAASGSRFHAKASPLLYSAVLSATDLVLSPNQTVAGQSVKDVWGGNITPAGSGDANRFMSIPCVSTLDIGFTPALGEPVFPYHTGFDSFEWMDQVGDPGWNYHVTSAKIWALMTAHLAEPQLLDLSVKDYAIAFQVWLGELKDRDIWSEKVDLTTMMDAVERLSRAASRFDRFARSLKELHCTQWSLRSSCRRDRAISNVNRVYMAFERQFYYEPGLDGHSDWHHVLFTPSAWHNTPPPMPGLAKNLLKQDWKNAQVSVFSCRDWQNGSVNAQQRWRDILTEKINSATKLLEEHMQVVDAHHPPGSVG